jgi:hypothetical protein
MAGLRRARVTQAETLGQPNHLALPSSIGRERSRLSADAAAYPGGVDLERLSEFS